jgi:hypothetical protein
MVDSQVHKQKAYMYIAQFHLISNNWKQNFPTSFLMLVEQNISIYPFLIYSSSLYHIHKLSLSLSPSHVPAGSR